MHGANDGLWDWNIKTNEIYFSPRWKAMLGCDEMEIGHSPDEWFNRIHPEDVRRVRAELDAHLTGQTPHFENEHRVLHKDGTCRWVLSRGFASRSYHGRPYRMAGGQTDVTDRRAYDPLTGLPNRALFLDRLQQAVYRAGREPGSRFAILFLDLDHLKRVNDSLGHPLGDKLLVALARRLETCLRPGDTLARFGGEYRLFVAKWGRYLDSGDPFYNPNFRLDRADYALRA